jgi:hypothetical protein
MTSDFGTGVSRVLSPEQAAMTQVIWQQGKPPLDSELNFIQQLAEDWRRIGALRGSPSGWLSNAVNLEDVFLTDSAWSNWFRFGQQKTSEKQAIQWAAVNGWIIPVTGTGTGTPPGSPNDADTWNKVTLDPPPSNSGDSRIDFVFLEAWLARVPPNPSSTNKPSTSSIYRYGNVEGGYTYLSDDLQDSAIGFETTQRVQLQYRIRVVSGLVGLTSYPDGFDPTVVKGRGAAASDTAYTFENMRQELGDAGLWRAGDGTANSLGTVDGYTYAVPLCVAFRRNSVAWDGDPGQNLNGGFDRNPTAIDRTGATTFSTTPTLASDLGGLSTDLSLDLVSVSDIDLPLTPATPVTIKVDDEYMTYSDITGTTMTLTARGALGSKAEAHLATATITVVAARPDGLFADQVAKTDILDLRHAVNPNGFDYDTLLKGNLDKLLRGEMRSTWKRSGGGPQGSFVFYQDKISASAAALGVTLLDAPDGHRTVFSDAAMQQVMEFVASPASGAGQPVTTTWSLSLTGTQTSQVQPNEFRPTDVITIPVAQLKSGLPGGDADQVRFISDTGAVKLRIDGHPYYLIEGFHYSVATITDPADDLVITLDGTNFPPSVTENLYITLHVQYGPGRGISRRPDSVHSVSYLSAGTDIMIQQAGVPADNTPTRTAWALLWSKYRNDTFRNLLPVTSESYIDLGSKTVILTPFRRIELPDQLYALDGTSVNPNYDEITSSGSQGVGNDTTTFNDTGTPAIFQTDGVVVGDILVVTAPAAAVGEYPITNVPSETQLFLDHPVPTATGIVYTVVPSQGLMPTDDPAGVAKWTTTDPLDLFSGSGQVDADRKNIYTTIPRRLMPGWGEVRVPIIHTDVSPFAEGINYTVLTTKGDKSGGGFNSEKNYIPFNNGSLSYVPFTTWDFNGSTAATYNASLTYGGDNFAGMRQFTDSLDLGREGLELPPFYGVARLFSVYEAQDFENNGGSSYNPTTREYVGGGATNLLRQNFDGATMWVEVDEDGDATFIINAEAIDISRVPSPYTPADFASGEYVIEANIFGFDRHSYDHDRNFRLVLARGRDTTQANTATRLNNVSSFFGGGATDAFLDSPDMVIPAPALASDEIAVNYSRTPYQGDAWGSQTSQQDFGHKQGPLLTSTAYQLASTELDEANLTRPNQKALEVLGSTGFVTTLGTGRLSGDFPGATFDFRNVGYEDLSAWPPASAVDPRPDIDISALVWDESGDISTQYHGCTERLPLGALWLDKDFRGGFVGADLVGPTRAALVYTETRAPGVLAASMAADQTFEQNEVSVSMSSLSSGQPGEVVVHVDGEAGNYGLLTNFRVNRGGSAFSATAPRPGGELASLYPPAGGTQTGSNVLVGVAYLVRNTVTAIGSTEVNAGEELMMVVVTSVVPHEGGPKDLKVFVGTNGTGEGYSAVDHYRLQGHPLVSDHIRFDVDPSSIQLAKKSDITF